MCTCTVLTFHTIGISRLQYPYTRITYSCRSQERRAHCEHTFGEEGARETARSSSARRRSLLRSCARTSSSIWRRMRASSSSPSAGVCFVAASLSASRSSLLALLTSGATTSRCKCKGTPSSGSGSTTSRSIVPRLRLLLQLEQRLRARRRGHGLEHSLQAVVLVAQVVDQLLHWILVHHCARLDSLGPILSQTKYTRTIYSNYTVHFVNTCMNTGYSRMWILVL